MQLPKHDAPLAVYYRGARIHRATVATLLAHEGLSRATDVILAGGSAGALAVYLHADSWRAAIPASAQVVAVPDRCAGSGRPPVCCTVFYTPDTSHSGFFLNWPNSTYSTSMRWLFSRMNATGGVPSACVAANAADPALCIFAENAAKTIKTPVFAQQSTYDSFQIQDILQRPFADTAAINAYGKVLGTRISASLIGSGANHAMFLDSCKHHVVEWDEITIDGQVVSAALAEFYESIKAGGGGKRVWAQGQTYPCDACCHNGQ